MTEELGNNKKNWLLIPVFGALLFIAVYTVAAHLYPGGSQVNKNSTGFSWVDNYWCNLLSDTAINGQPNPAKWVAIAGMMVLGLTLLFFWFLFTRYLISRPSVKHIVRISGILAIAISFLLLTNFNHDLIIDFACSFGLIATIGIFAGLYENKWYKLLAFGILNILLVGLNNYVYYKKGFIIYLPVIQKMTFATYLVWVCTINIYLYRKALPAKQV